jgi:hypothetical protein
MVLCHLEIPTERRLSSGKEIILSWDRTAGNMHQTKVEYINIFEDAQYQIDYQIRWVAQDTTQPLQVTIYRVTKEYTVEPIHQQLTVSTGSAINLSKNIPADLKAQERICIGVKNFSITEFILVHCKFSLTKL